MNKLAVRVSIDDPMIEGSVHRVLKDLGISCQGRYLTPDDVPSSLRVDTLLITTSGQSQKFAHTIVVDETNLLNLPDLLSFALSNYDEKDRTNLHTSNNLVYGVLPRVGATTLQEIIEREVGLELFVYRKRAFQIIVSEIDDSSLTRLFEVVDEEISHEVKRIAIINKLPESTAARRKFLAVERELGVKQIAFTQPILFDAEIQVTGAPTKRMLRSAQPLFDWIAKAN